MQAALRTALLQPLLLNSAHRIAGPLGAACSLQTHASSACPGSIVDKAHDGQQQQQQTRATVGLAGKKHSVGHGFAAGYASSSSEVTTTTPAGVQNSWTKFRAPYGFEQKSSLGPAMYLMIGVFGFSMYTNNLIYHPPRVAGMLALMMLLMYVRK